MIFHIVVMKIGLELKKIETCEKNSRFFSLVGKILTVYFTHFYTGIYEQVKIVKNCDF